MTTTEEICAACHKRPSETAEGESGPPLCQNCWERWGQGIEIGTLVIDTVAGYRGRVRDFTAPAYIAIVDLDEGGEAHLPTATLVAILS